MTSKLDAVFDQFRIGLEKPWNISLGCSIHLLDLMIIDFADRWDGLIEKKEDRLRADLLLALVAVPRKSLRTPEMISAVTKLLDKVASDPNQYIRMLVSIVKPFCSETATLDLEFNRIFTKASTYVAKLKSELKQCNSKICPKEYMYMTKSAIDRMITLDQYKKITDPEVVALKDTHKIPIEAQRLARYSSMKQSSSNEQISPLSNTTAKPSFFRSRTSIQTAKPFGSSSTTSVFKRENRSVMLDVETLKKLEAGKLAEKDKIKKELEDKKTKLAMEKEKKERERLEKKQKMEEEKQRKLREIEERKEQERLKKLEKRRLSEEKRRISTESVEPVERPKRLKTDSLDSASEAAQASFDEEPKNSQESMEEEPKITQRPKDPAKLKQANLIISKILTSDELQDLDQQSKDFVIDFLLGWNPENLKTREIELNHSTINESESKTVRDAIILVLDYGNF